MEKLKSETIAIPNDVLLAVLYNSKKIRSVKAFCLVLSQIYWGSYESGIFDDYKTSTVSLEFETIAQALGYKVNERLKTEVKKIYREMNEEIFGDEKYFYFHYAGYSKDKKKAIFKITKSSELYNLGEKGSFTKFSIQDILNCQNLYNFRVLVLVSTTKPSKNNEIILNTIFLKYRVFGMDLYKYCFINKKHPKYSEYFIESMDCYISQRIDKEINKDEFNNSLQILAFHEGFENSKEMIKAFNEIVTFNNRKVIEDILEESLKIINKGNRFKILENKDTKLHFKKTHKKGWKIEYYKIKVIKTISRN